MALADHQPRVRHRQLRMQLGPRLPLHAVRGPEHLLAIRQRGGLERRRAGMVGRERHVVGRVPVLRQHHMRERLGQPVDHRHDLVAVRHGERAAGHEVVLHIDHQQAIAVAEASLHGRVHCVDAVPFAAQPLKPLPSAASFLSSGAGSHASPW